MIQFEPLRGRKGKFFLFLLIGTRSAAHKRNEQHPARRDQTVQVNLISSRFVHTICEMFFIVRFMSRVLLVCETSSTFLPLLIKYLKHLPPPL
jgi:hypothetical protein